MSLQRQRIVQRLRLRETLENQHQSLLRHQRQMPPQVRNQSLGEQRQAVLAALAA